MALSNYSDLQQAIADFMNRDDLGTYIPTFIALAEARIARDCKTDELVKVTTMSIDANSKALPSDFAGMKYFKIDGDYPTLDYLTPDSFYSRIGAVETNRPAAYTIMGNSIYFLPLPDTTYTATYAYVAKPDIATDNTNRMLTMNPDVYLHGSLLEAADFLKDEEQQASAAAKYKLAIDTINGANQYLGPPSQQLNDIP